MKLPEAVRHARKELGLSQQKLAELAGIERKQLSTLEHGGNVTLRTLRSVLAQLPNLRSFELETVTPVTVSVSRANAQTAAVEEVARLVNEAARVRAPLVD